MSISMNHENANWEPLIVMLSSLNGLLLPILIAICVSRICDMEHKGNTWKLLLPLSVNTGRIYAAKYICAFILMLWACAMQVFSIAAFGIVKDFEDSIPIFLLVKFFLGIVFTSMAVIALQQWVSIVKEKSGFCTIPWYGNCFIGLTTPI